VQERFNDETPGCMTVSEAAGEFEVSQRTLRRRIQEGTIQGGWRETLGPLQRKGSQGHSGEAGNAFRVNRERARGDSSSIGRAPGPGRRAGISYLCEPLVRQDVAMGQFRCPCTSQLLRSRDCSSARCAKGSEGEWLLGTNP
jgi:hypothetical protein